MNEGDINKSKLIEFSAKYPSGGCGFAYFSKKNLLNSLKVALNQKGVNAEFKMSSDNNISEFNIYLNDILLFTSDSNDIKYHSFLRDESNQEDLVEKLYNKCKED